jgi:hypothetical protein
MFAGVVGLAVLGGGVRTAGADEGTNAPGEVLSATVAGEAVQGVPEISSVAPHWGPAGWVFSLTLEGRNLTGASEVRFVPSTGIVVEDSPVVNSEGTIATVKVTILVHAPLGPRLVVVRTATGQSSLTPTEANTFKVSFAHMH